MTDATATKATNDNAATPWYRKDAPNYVVAIMFAAFFVFMYRLFDGERPLSATELATLDNEPCVISYLQEHPKAWAHYEGSEKTILRRKHLKDYRQLCADTAEREQRDMNNKRLREEQDKAMAGATPAKREMRP